MKVAGFLLMMAGLAIALASVLLLKTLPSRTTFVLAGGAIEILGFVSEARSQVPARGKKSAA